MTKKQLERDAGLFLPTRALNNTSTSLAPYESKTPKTKEERRFTRELASQERAQWGYKHEAERAAALLSELSVSAAWLYAGELQEYDACKQSLQGNSYQAMGEQFLFDVARQSGNNKLRLIEVAGSNIAAEVHRSLYFEPEDQKLLERITGSWKR